MSESIRNAAPRATLLGVKDGETHRHITPKLWSLSVSPELVFVLNNTLITQFNVTELIDGYEFVNKLKLDAFYYGQPKSFLTTCPDEIEVIYRVLIGCTVKPIGVLVSVVGGLISFSIQLSDSECFVRFGPNFSYE